MVKWKMYNENGEEIPPTKNPLEAWAKLQEIANDPEAMQVLSLFFALPDSRRHLLDVLLAGYRAEKDRDPIKGHTIEEIVKTGYTPDGEIADTEYRDFLINADKLYKDYKKPKVYQPVDALTAAAARAKPRDEDCKELEIVVKDGNDSNAVMLITAGDGEKTIVQGIGHAGMLVLIRLVSICFEGKREISDNEIARRINGNKHPSGTLVRTVGETVERLMDLNQTTIGNGYTITEKIIPGKRVTRTTDGRKSTIIYADSWLMALYNKTGRLTTWEIEQAAFPFKLTERNAELYDHIRRYVTMIKDGRRNTKYYATTIYQAVNAQTKSEKQDARENARKLLKQYVDTGVITSCTEGRDEGGLFFKITYKRPKNWQRPQKQNV